jgi:hypothetical protein
VRMSNRCWWGGKVVSALDWFVPCWFTFRREIPFAALSQFGNADCCL